MPCHYCGKPIPITRRLKDPDFCSDDHRERYHDLSRLALQRLIEASPQGRKVREPARPEAPQPEGQAEPAAPASAFEGAAQPQSFERIKAQRAPQMPEAAARAVHQAPRPAGLCPMVPPPPARIAAQCVGPQGSSCTATVRLPAPAGVTGISGQLPVVGRRAIPAVSATRPETEYAGPSGEVRRAPRAVLPTSKLKVVRTAARFAMGGALPMQAPFPARAGVATAAAAPRISSFELHRPRAVQWQPTAGLAPAAPVTSSAGRPAVGRLPGLSLATGVLGGLADALALPAPRGQPERPVLRFAGLRSMPGSSQAIIPAVARVAAPASLLRVAQKPTITGIPPAAGKLPSAGTLELRPVAVRRAISPDAAGARVPSGMVRSGFLSASGLLPAVLKPAPPLAVTACVAVSEAPCHACLPRLAGPPPAFPAVPLRTEGKLDSAGWVTPHEGGPADVPSVSMSSGTSLGATVSLPDRLPDIASLHCALPFAPAAMLWSPRPSSTAATFKGRDWTVTPSGPFVSSGRSPGYATAPKLPAPLPTPLEVEPVSPLRADWRIAGTFRFACPNRLPRRLEAAFPRGVAPRAGLVAPRPPAVSRPVASLKGLSEELRFAASAVRVALGGGVWPLVAGAGPPSALPIARPLLGPVPSPAGSTVAAQACGARRVHIRPRVPQLGVATAGRSLSARPAGGVAVDLPPPAVTPAVFESASWCTRVGLLRRGGPTPALPTRGLAAFEALADHISNAAVACPASAVMAAPAIPKLPIQRARLATPTPGALSPAPVGCPPKAPALGAARDPVLEQGRARLIPAMLPPVHRSSGASVRAVHTFMRLPPCDPAPKPRRARLEGMAAGQEPRWRTRSRLPGAVVAPATVQFELPPAPPLWLQLLNVWRGLPAMVRAAMAFAALFAGLGWVLWVAAGEAIGAQLERRAAVRLEENFQRGFASWWGQPDWAESWRRSPSGYAEIGRLALWRPTRQMSDYQIEFLAQLGNRGIGWVFRAADLENYYAMRLAVMKPGPLPSLALIRTTVVAGKEQQKVQIPVRARIQQDVPVRVRMLIRGDGFTTWIADQLADYWRDDRFRAGGMGFFAEPGDRAQLYWVRLTHQDDFLGKLCAYLAPSHREGN